MKCLAISIVVGAATAAVSLAAHAAPADDATGFHVGASLGASHFDTQGVAALPASSDKRGAAFRAYAGYPLNEHLGLQVGWANLSRLEARYVGTSGTVRQTASGRSLYLAGTGRLPLGESFALTAKAGVSFGRASGTNSLGAADSLTGSKTSAMTGIGAEYRFNRRVAMTADYERYGRLSNRLEADALYAGGRFSF